MTKNTPATIRIRITHPLIAKELGLQPTQGKCSICDNSATYENGQGHHLCDDHEYKVKCERCGRWHDRYNENPIVKESGEYICRYCWK